MVMDEDIVVQITCSEIVDGKEIIKESFFTVQHHASQYVEHLI